ncbi:hypothetical protein AAAU27_13000 [Bacteroides ovatus]|uniref:hypothetical protein n=1 Tax=Bacteroides ovatus TaxID=28116 RepID=UPI0032C09DFB
MGAIGLNPIRLDRIGLDPIRINAIKLGVPGAASDRPYIDPEVLASLKAVCICYGKSNDDPDRAVVKNLVDPDNPFVISNAAYTEGSGYADKDSPYYGAFVTDGIDDLITSTKTVQEMGITDEVTVVSMIHQIALNPTYNVGTTNYLENLDNGKHIRSDVYYAGKTGIYGYTASLINNTASDIKNILGDKADYSTQKNEPSQTLHNSKFSVVGRARNLTEPSSVAWYWTVIANKVLTTDQINQVIAYFNLDRTLKPDILCDVKKQGITNENHAEFGDKLIDFSDNGRDIQLNNIAWDGDSGIGKYSYPGWKLTANKAGKYRNIRIYQTLNGTYTAKFEGVTELYNRVGIELEILSKNRYVQIKEDGIYSVDPVDDATELQVRFGDYTDTELYDCDITITQIPSHAGALCLDGVNDFGKATGMPIYKDYTFIIDYERISYTSEGWGGAIVSKSPSANNGAFISMMANSAGTNKQLFSFGGVTAFIKDDLSRILFWQTKYKSENTELTVGEGVDGDTLWLGTLRDNDSRFFNGAIYSLMSFPYSMSEFLIERQLKKHKLGTLYPDMVEFRPIVKSNSEYQVVDYYIDTLPAVVGNYYPINSKLRIAVTTKGAADEVTSLTINGMSLGTPSVNGNRFTFNGTLSDKSPQKINITIYQPPEYLTMLSNSTLISNETLIKNE